MNELKEMENKTNYNKKSKILDINNSNSEDLMKLFGSENIFNYILAIFALIGFICFFYFLAVLFNVPLAGVNVANQMRAKLPLGI